MNEKLTLSAFSSYYGDQAKLCPGFQNSASAWFCTFSWRISFKRAFQFWFFSLFLTLSDSHSSVPGRASQQPCLPPGSPPHGTLRTELPSFPPQRTKARLCPHWAAGLGLGLSVPWGMHPVPPCSRHTGTQDTHGWFPSLRPQGLPPCGNCDFSVNRRLPSAAQAALDPGDSPARLKTQAMILCL